MKAVILAGGKGTRLADLTREIPKPMLPLAGKPLLEYHIALLKKYGIREIFITVNYLRQSIIDHFGNGEKFGVEILYYEEKEPLGTVGGIKALEDQLQEDFLVIYGDVMVEMDLQRLMDFHKAHASEATLVVHPNDHPHDSDLVQLELSGRIRKFYPKPRPEGGFYPNMVNAGLYVFTPAVFPFLEAGRKADFGREIFPLLPGKLKMFGYNTSEYLKDMGTPDRLEKVEKDILSGKVQRKSLENPQKAIFLDRDGVLNEDSDLVHLPEQLDIFPFTAEAIRKINQSGYLSVITTNQSVVARNLTTVEGLEEIHAKLETVLGEQGAWVDAIYYCPHHPDKGYPGENPEYKIDCDCRKPKPGMLLEAARHFHINTSESWMIGDSERDVSAGRSAGCITVGVDTGNGLRDANILPDYHFPDLLEAVEFIIKDPYQNIALQLLEHISPGVAPYIIGIGGNTRSGKSTLAKTLELKLKKAGKSVRMIALDDWILPESERKVPHDFLANFQSEKMVKDIERILAGEKIISDGYARHPKRSRVPAEYQYQGEEVIIIEGVIALHVPALRKLFRAAIFKEISMTALEEKMKHYYTWKGLDRDTIDKKWTERLALEYLLIDADRQWADISV